MRQWPFFMKKYFYAGIILILMVFLGRAGTAGALQPGGCYCVDSNCDSTKMDCTEKIEPNLNQLGCVKNIDPTGIGRNLQCHWVAEPEYIDYCCCKVLAQTGTGQAVQCVEAQNTQEYEFCNQQVYEDFNTELDKLGTCKCDAQAYVQIDMTDRQDCTGLDPLNQTCVDFKSACRDTTNYKNCKLNNANRCICNAIQQPKTTTKVLAPTQDETWCTAHNGTQASEYPNCVWTPGYQRQQAGYIVKPDDKQQCQTYTSASTAQPTKAFGPDTDFLKNEAKKLNKMTFISSPAQLIGLGIKLFVGVIGMLALVFYIYAGFVYMTAAGNAERYETAKRIFVWVTLAVVVTLASYLIIDNIFTFLKGG